MRIAVAGAGGVGGLLAGLLSRAGNDVVLVARGAHGEAIRRDGLRIASPLGSFTARVAAVSDEPAALGPADAVLVAVKSWQVAGLAPRRSLPGEASPSPWRTAWRPRRSSPPGWATRAWRAGSSTSSRGSTRRAR